METRPDGSFILRRRDELKAVYENLFFAVGGEEKKKSFISKWLTDATIRTYERINFLPPPLQCPTDVYNLWTGFAAERMTCSRDVSEELAEMLGYTL